MKSKIKRISIVILILAIVASVAIFIFRAQIIKHFIPDVEQIGDIHFNVKNDTIYIKTKLVVKNKMFLKVEIDTIKYKISLFDKTYLQNEKFIGMILRGHGKDTIDFSLKIPYVKILNNFKVEKGKKDSVNYSLAIYIQYSTVFGKTEIPITKSSKLKIPQPPEIDVVEIKYKKVRFNTILADAKIKIINHSSITLSIKELSYSMNILKQGSLNGNFRKPINIKPHETTLISIPIEINPKNIGKTIFEIIINKDNYDYILTLNAILESTDPLKKSFQIDITKNGKMELRK